MVYASNGVLVTTDIPTKELLLYENNKAPASSKFIISVLDDTHIFIKADKIDLVREKVTEFNDKNVYQPPTDKEDAQKAGFRR